MNRKVMDIVAMSNAYIYPKYQVAPEGKAVSISCDSKMNFALGVPKWSKDGVIVPELNFLRTILLSNISFIDSGYYSCIGFDDKDGLPFNATSTLIVAGRNGYK